MTIVTAMEAATTALNEAAAQYFAMRQEIQDLLDEALQLLITTPVTKTVHGVGADFANMNAATAWLSERRITIGGSVTFVLAAGVGGSKHVYNASVVLEHPDGRRVTVRGQPLSGPQPAPLGLAATGTSGAARAADTAANLATLRAVYTTELHFTGGNGIHLVGPCRNLQDILVTSDGAGALTDNLLLQNGDFNLTRVAAVGANYRGISAFSSTVTITGVCYAIGGAHNGFEAGGGTTMSVYGILAALGNAYDGVAAFNNGSVVCSPYAAGTALVTRGNGSNGQSATENSGITNNGASVSSGNGAAGCYAGPGGVIRATGQVSASNGQAGFYANSGVLVAPNSSGAGNGEYGYYAYNGGQVIRTGGTATGGTAMASPAVGVTGNNNALIS